MANQHIKGITVEIGGDTSELTAALKNIDKASKKSSDELKSINAALKLDPSNTVLLAQKQEALASAIGTSREKLELLKKAEQDAQKQFENGDISAEQYRALQREVVFAENKLNKLEKQYEDTKNAAEDAGKAAHAAGEEIKDAGKVSDKAAEQTEDLSKELDELKDKYDDAKEAAKDAAKEMAAPFAAAGAAVGASVAVAMSYEDALDSIQMQTGANAEKMVLYKTAMESVFSTGLGEDLDDVASSMATIAQQTKESDPDKLKELTENALILKDGFGFETAEQMRAVNMLTTQFGISSAQAYNLIVQGAQKGLNKNGDLLDVINEYSVHYKNLGYSADEFFNSLINGAETGVFSVDKLGDGMKEFGIRTKDTSSATTEALSQLGYVSETKIAELKQAESELLAKITEEADAKKIQELQLELSTLQGEIISMESALVDGNGSVEALQERLANGGADARAAAEEINALLFDVEDSVVRNQVGVALYGTMWEDMGEDAIRAIGDVNGKIDSTANAMKKVRDVKMDATSTKWAQLGRTVQTELLVPLGEKALPTVKKVVSYLTTNADKLIPKIKGIATTAASMWAGAKIGKFIASVTKVVQTYKSLKTATTAANAAMAATPWGAVGAAAGFLIGTIGSLIESQSDAEEAAREAAEAEKARIAALKEAAEETRVYYQDMADAAIESSQERREAAKEINDEHDYYEDLWEDLQKLVDAEGNVKKGNEERVEHIYGELQEAIGFENKLVDGQIEKYGELQTTIAETIQMRRANALLDKNQADYESAKESLPELQTEYETANETANEFDVRTKAVAEKKALLEQHKRDLTFALESTDDLAEQNAIAQRIWPVIEMLEKKIRDDESWLTENAYAHENAKTARFAYDSATNTVAEYEALEEGILSEDSKAIDAAVAAISDGFLSYLTGASADALNVQSQSYIDQYHMQLEYSRNAGSSVTQEQVDEAARNAMSAAYKVFEYVRETGKHDVVSVELMEFLRQFDPGADITDAIANAFSEVAFADYFLNASKDGGGAPGDIKHAPTDLPGIVNRLGQQFNATVDQAYERSHSESRSLISGLGEQVKDTMMHTYEASNAKTLKNWQEITGIAERAFTSKSQNESTIGSEIVGAIQSVNDRINKLEMVVEIDGDVVAKKILNRVDRQLGSRAKFDSRASVK